MTPGRAPARCCASAAQGPAFRAPERAARALGRAAAYARWRAHAAGRAGAARRRRPRRRGGDPRRRARPRRRLAAPGRGRGAAGAPTGSSLVEQRRRPVRRGGGQGRGGARRAGRAQGRRARRRAQGAGGRGAARALRSDRGPARRAGDRARLEGAGAPVDGFLVQRMADPGVEMLVGVLADERFGPVVACGAGGGDGRGARATSQVRLAPLAREEARDMIRALRSLALLERARRGRRRARRHRRPRRRARRRASGDRRARLQPGDGRRRRRAGGRRARARRAAGASSRVFPARRPMKRIGLLGGDELGVLGRVLPARQRAGRASALGGLHSADCLLRSVDFAEIEVLQREGAGTRRARGSRREARALEAAGAELLVLCTNTMHKLARRDRPRRSTIPFVHIADTTADAVHGAGLHARRPAGDRVHDGAGLLRRPAARARARRCSCRTPRTAGSSTT